VGREIRLLDYIEDVGQPLGYYAHEMRRRGWNDVIVYLPHDGVATNNITGKRCIDHWIEAGFECGTPIKNTGAGAAMMRYDMKTEKELQGEVAQIKFSNPHGSLSLVTWRR
jgi:phage terminase large subunit